MGTEHDPWPAYQTFLSSPAGKNYLKGDIPIKPDGSFRIEDVPPEYYQLFVIAKVDSGKSQNIGGTKLTVKTIPDGQSNEPLDIGEVKVTPDDKAKRDAAEDTDTKR